MIYVWYLTLNENNKYTQLNITPIALYLAQFISFSHLVMMSTIMQGTNEFRCRDDNNMTDKSIIKIYVMRNMYDLFIID